MGSDTVLSQIIKLVRDAQGSKPPIQQIADKVVAILYHLFLSSHWLHFLSGILLLEVLCFSPLQLIAIMVIACPCALGLASPTAVTVGIGRRRAWHTGKNGGALESAQKSPQLF